MLDLDQVLIVDGSRIVRDLLARLMRRHSTATHALDDCAKAREWIERNGGLSLVIVDRDAPGGGGFALLEFLATLPQARPSAILIGRCLDADDRTRADLLGAIGCLSKPISFQMVAQTVAASHSRPFAAASPRLYARPPAQVQLLDPDSEWGQILWNVHDLSLSGALIDTRGPIPVGTRLPLSLQVGDDRFDLESEVVRIQEPDWNTLPGVAVRFVAPTAAQLAGLERSIRRGRPTQR